MSRNLYSDAGQSEIKRKISKRAILCSTIISLSNRSRKATKNVTDDNDKNNFEFLIVCF